MVFLLIVFWVKEGLDVFTKVFLMTEEKSLSNS